MTHPIKKVDVDCYEPLAFNKDYEQGWSDVYLSYDAKPGRKRYHYGPTLMSRGDVEGEIEFLESFHQQYPQWCVDDEVNEVDQMRCLLGLLEYVPIIITDISSRTPDIYTSRSSINHDEAERMIRFFMEMKGFPRVRLRWRRPKHGMMIIPVSFS